MLERKTICCKPFNGESMMMLTSSLLSLISLKIIIPMHALLIHYLFITNEYSAQCLPYLLHSQMLTYVVSYCLEVMLC